MSNSTTNLDQISVSQAQKEVTANALFDAGSSAMTFGRRGSTTTGLTWGYYGGNFLVGGVPTQIANGTIALTGSTTNYLYATAGGTVTKVTSAPSGWPGPLAAGAVALYSIVTGSATVTSYTDYRSGISVQGSAFTGDSGSGGVAGLVPAPAAGDAASAKVLLASGGWGQVAPTGSFSAATQGYLGSRVFAFYTAQGAGGLEYGVSSTITGTSPVGASQTSTNFFTQSRRVVYASAVAINDSAGQHWNAFKLWRGNAANLGGFLYTSRMGADSWHSDGRWAVGLMQASGLPGVSAEPSSVVNSILIGQDSGDTNIQVMSHDGTSGSTKANLGASFPRPTATVSWYEFTLYAQPNASSIQYIITNLTTGATASGNVTATLPVSTVFLHPFRYSNTGPTQTSSVEINLGNAYIESNY